ncbi:MAG: immunity 26/phosphotriesterase HocA family protein [Ardenticatenaceae bacterium]|nr:immunity 26/phosphotriesterase HocA family protein [Ardenticatenaceae bacterium]
MKRIQLGDVLEIPLSDGRKAYGQYVFKDKMGPLVQVFDLITKDNIELEQIKNAKLLFPPVFTGLFAAVRGGVWKVIGRIPIEEFKYPGFISVYVGPSNQVGTWYLWDGKQSIPIGHKLPKEFKQLEQMIVWDPNNLAHRIETGVNPYDYLVQA